MDLNVIIGQCHKSNLDNEQIIRQKLERCKALGFHTVAVSVIMDATESLIVPPPPDLKSLIPDKLRVLTRLTVKFSENIQLFKIHKNKDTNKYDLLALQPLNSKMLQYVSMGQTELDILTFELGERMDFKTFKIRYKILEQKGVCIEINYGPAQLGSSLRRNIISNGQSLIESSIKNIILSSGVDDVFRLRSPKDAKCLGPLFMMPSSRCHDAVFNNGNKAINLSKHRKDQASSAIESIIVE